MENSSYRHCLEANKAQRLQQVKKYLTDDDFFLAYGDDLSDVDLDKVYKFHKDNDKAATITAVRMESPFGVLEMNDESEITKFKEKPVLDYFMNGGYMALNKRIFSYMQDGFELENEVFDEAIKKNDIQAYTHHGFWKSMNTFKDTQELNEMWKKNDTKWKLWK